MSVSAATGDCCGSGLHGFAPRAMPSRRPARADGDHLRSRHAGHAFRVMKRGEQWVSEKVWENNDVTMDMSRARAGGSTLFGFSARNSGQFFGIDANTGQTLWLSEGRQAENAAVVRAGDVWLRGKPMRS